MGGAGGENWDSRRPGRQFLRGYRFGGFGFRRTHKPWRLGLSSLRWDGTPRKLMGMANAKIGHVGNEESEPPMYNTVRAFPPDPIAIPSIQGNPRTPIGIEESYLFCPPTYLQ